MLMPALTLIVFAGSTVAVIASPAVMRRLYSDTDYSVIADVGQAYGGASAVVACIALFVVAASILLQYRQLKEVRRDAAADFAEDLVLLAMKDPKYRQCWGSRVAPDGVDEDLFYYCSKVIKNWARLWALDVIDEAQAREYLRSFFDSEVPRMFWEKHSEWHRRKHGRRRREHFRDLVNDEYLRALRAGPPSRSREYCEAIAEAPTSPSRSAS
ncbi:hypothetical protein JIG36_50740 [Actinoplanes sp. LDG1-06]|uniref:Uncharacterized protein n=1 Tax=Paractinoplanes ovalisporus TaxID=2810368 RepID=A0ABS2AX38_9ACTN|nr:DUF6082 family protein [Actinoplanes ovalisporus]MBM2623796.1 hypothetical protein [Actinoplanes ovalisporus]